MLIVRDVMREDQVRGFVLMPGRVRIRKFRGY